MFSEIYVITFREVQKSLPLHKGAFFMFIYDLSIFLTSTAFVSTNAKYGISLSRYTVFLQNCPLEYRSKSVFFLFGAGNQNRTDDLVITNDVLYRLSHTSIVLATLIL